MIDRNDLIKAGAHWGHLRSRWCPRMAPYIWGLKDRVHLIDVSKTAIQLEKAANFLQKIAAEGKIVLWVGTKPSAREAVQSVAERLNMPYVNHRWVGGTLSNYAQVKKSVTRLLHFEDILDRAAEFPLYTKKDMSIIQKNIQRRDRTVGGIRKMIWPIGAIVLVDVNEEASALRESQLMGVPVVAIVDTNGDPSRVDYVIPANDDTPSSVKLLINYLGDAVTRGVEAASAKKLVRQVENSEQLPGVKEVSAIELLGIEGVVGEGSEAPGKKSVGGRSRVNPTEPAGSSRGAGQRPGRAPVKRTK